MSDNQKNRVAINENRKRVFAIDAEVMTNKALKIELELFFPIILTRTYQLKKGKL